MSLSVSIEPGPCGLAEGSGGVTSVRTQPHPKREEEAGRGSGAQGFRGQGQGSRGRRAWQLHPRAPHLCHLCRDHLLRPQRAPGRWGPASGKGELVLPARAWQPAGGKLGGAELPLSALLWFDIFLDSMLQFWVSCLVWVWVWFCWGFFCLVLFCF